jgi:elongation factor Ts
MNKPYPNLKDYKRHKRSPFFGGKNIRLSENNLTMANHDALIRLANWLEVLPAKSNILSEKEWIQKVRCAIAREEKRLFGLPNQGRKEEKKMENKVELIKKLRVLTNAPMGDCISALQESNNDLDKAVDWLKVKGLNSGGKIVDELKEGRIECFVTTNSTVTLVQINCQTDFGAKSELVENCLGEVSMVSQTGTKEFLTFERDLAYKLGEAVKIKVHVEPFDPKNEYIASYIHPNKKIGVLLKVEDTEDNAWLSVAKGADFGDIYDNLCMQVAATNTLSIFPEDLPTDVVARQKAVFEEQVKLLKKPELVSEKILEGKMNGWYAEVCLMKQGCVWEPKLSIEKYLKKQEEICGHPIVVKKFVKFVI